MSKKEILIARNNTARKFTSPKSNAPRQRNAIFINTNNTLEHELAKFVIGYITAAGGDVEVLFPYFIPRIKEFAKGIPLKKWCFKNSKREFITEAKEKATNKIRDFVCLDSGEIIEIIVSHGDPNEEELQHTKLLK